MRHEEGTEPVSDAEAFDAFQRGRRLLDSGDAHAASVALEQARALEPGLGSVREALARAYFRSGRYQRAAEEFAASVEIEPVNDYAHFGLGLSLLRTGDRRAARRHLQLATAMRPDNADYRAALADVSSDEPAAGDALGAEG